MSYAIIMTEKRKLFHPIQIEELLDEVHIRIPELKEKNEQKYGKKINKILQKYKVSNVVLSNELAEKEIFRNTIVMQNNYMITGNKLYKSLLKLILQDICNILEIPLPSISVAILSHEFSIENLDLVKYISQEVKQLVLVSENKKRFESMLKDFWQQEGIPITILEGKDSNISRYPIILNLDYTEEELKKLVLPKEAIIISIHEKITSLRKSFNGILIHDIDIYLGKEITSFRTLALCEAYIYNYRKKIKENEKEFQKSSYQINGYIGNNGKITEEDFKRVKNSFTKKSKK